MRVDERSDALHAIARGAEFPYDAPDTWERGEPLPPSDFAHVAARGILGDLTDRRGIKREFENIDEDIRAEIVNAMANIIRIAQEITNGGGEYEDR